MVGTCFTLYEQARLETNPEMARQLCAYREASVESDRCHRWENVARYDRCFRLAAAGKPRMAWDKMDAALLVREVTTPATIAGRGPSGPGNRGGQSAHGGVGPKREKRQQGTCYRYNRQNGSCTFGQQCRFMHMCAGCGGEHPVSQCSSKHAGKGPEVETGGRR